MEWRRAWAGVLGVGADEGALAPGPPVPASRPDFPRTLSTLHWPRRPAWMSRVDVIDPARSSTLARLRRLAGARGYAAVVVDGATGGAVRLADMGAAAVLARRRRGPVVIVTDATWKRGRPGVDRLLRRAGLAAIEGPRTVYCVLSSAELRTFPASWGVDPARVAFTPFYFTMGDAYLALAPSRGGYVFAGGDSLRDYEPLLAAAAGVAAPFRLATRALEGRRGLPVNVSAGFVKHPEFMALMRGASAVVVPLARRTDRSAGQQTYLNAMALGKLVIVPDVLGVRDYVVPGETGLVVPPDDPHALSEALRWALAPENSWAVEAMGRRARAHVFSRFTPEHYVEHVMDVVERFAAHGRAR